MNKFVKIILTAGVLLIAYGFLCKATNIRFFWESSALGWDLGFIGVLFLLAQQQKKRKSIGKNTVLIKVGIGLLVFILVIQVVLSIVVSNSDAYIAAKNYLLKNDSLKNELGNINGFGLIPTGGMSVSSDSAGEEGNAQINIIIKGSKKFKAVTIFLEKEKKTNWEVKSVE
ncbi:MAG TPA: hypothetical protein VNS58_11360 [Puia sp.]|nr:hypothetical protein [Puia sp.]